MAMEIPEDVKGMIYQAWLPALMTTLLAGVKQLPREQRQQLLTQMCTTCEELAMAGAVGIQPGMSWDEYLDYLRQAIPPVGPWTVEQSGDAFDLIYDCTVGEDGKPRCHCPLVQLGISEPTSECCDSGARLSARMIGAATGKMVEKAEVVDSPLTSGASVCRYRVHVRP